MLDYLQLVLKLLFHLGFFLVFYLFYNNRALKRITEDDLKFPLVFGEGKRARVLATIGVTRGFGDHDLKVCGTDIYIKPFLSPAPDVSHQLVCSPKPWSKVR